MENEEIKNEGTIETEEEVIDTCEPTEVIDPENEITIDPAVGGLALAGVMIVGYGAGKLIEKGCKALHVPERIADAKTKFLDWKDERKAIQEAKKQAVLEAKKTLEPEPEKANVAEEANKPENKTTNKRKA